LSQSDEENEVYVYGKKDRRNSRIEKMLVEGSLYEGSSITSNSGNETTFFPEEEIAEEKEESELWNIQIENMEILHKQNELKTLQSIPIYGAVHPSNSDATREKSKRKEQNRESQIVRGYCEVYYSPDPQQDRKIKQHRDPKLGANSQLQNKTLSFSVQTWGNTQRQRHPIPKHDVIMNKKSSTHPKIRKEDHKKSGTNPEFKNTNGAGTIQRVWQYGGNESKQGDRNIVGVLHSQQSESIELKQQTGVDLSVNFEEINKVNKLSEALTDTKLVSSVKRQTDDVKSSEALSATLIGRNKEQKLKSIKLKKIGYDIRQWMTSKSKTKNSKCAKFFPIFHHKKNIES